MKDLTKSHVDQHRNSEGIIRVENRGWLVGVVGDVAIQLDPLVRITIRGTYADGTPVNEDFDVPSSIVRAGALPIMQYLTDKYGIKAS